MNPNLSAFIRGGAGIFDMLILPYNFQGRLTRSVPYFVGASYSNAAGLAAAFPNQILPLLGKASLGVAHVEPDPGRGYKGQWNLNIQRQLNRTMALTVGYVGASGVRLVRPVEDIDQVPGYLARFDTASNSYRFPIPAGNNRNLIQRINPNYGSLRSTEWGGHSIYHALQVNLVLNYSYDIPMPAAIRSNRFSNTVLGGWSIGGIYTRQSGGPYSVKIGVDRAFTGNSNAGGSLNSAARHMFVLNSTCTSPAAAVTGVIGKYLNLNCFAFPEAGQLGNLGRNNLTMPTFRNLDFSIFKNQNLMGEKLKAQLRVEMFNVMNNTNIQPQLQTIFDGNGAITSQAGTPTGQFGTFTTNQSRQIQLGLRLIF